MSPTACSWRPRRSRLAPTIQAGSSGQSGDRSASAFAVTAAAPRPARLRALSKTRVEPSTDLAQAISAGDAPRSRSPAGTTVAPLGTGRHERRRGLRRSPGAPEPALESGRADRWLGRWRGPLQPGSRRRLSAAGPSRARSPGALPARLRSGGGDDRRPPVAEHVIPAEDQGLLRRRACIGGNRRSRCIRRRGGEGGSLRCGLRPTSSLAGPARGRIQVEVRGPGALGLSFEAQLDRGRAPG